MKTTVDLDDALFARAKRHAKESGRTLRELLQDGLRRVLDDGVKGRRYRLPDRSVGDPRSKNPLETLSWQDLRDEIYGGR
jgi:hypothetical protein